MEQLTSMTLRLRPQGAAEGGRWSWSLGPYLQGALMELVDPAYAARLHQLPFNPCSQHCVWEGNSLAWRVCALTDEAAAQIIEPLRRLETLELRAVHAVFEVEGTTQETMSARSLQKVASTPSEPRVRVRFVTPTAFKSQGEYQIMPSSRLLFQNLLMHYGQVYANDKEGFEETVDYIGRQVRISAYDLRSRYFAHVAGRDAKIPAFVGTMTLSLRGPDMAQGLVRMLLRFGEFAGVGIKTSMGMGGFRIV